MDAGSQGGAGDRERAGASEQRLRGPWWSPKRELTARQRGNVLSQVFFLGADRRPFLLRFSALLAFSVLIAVFGLARDSGPVVIGAMLVSPLTTPLMGLSTALVLAWPRRQLESFAILVAASLGGIAIAWLAMKVIPEPQFVTRASEELLARTEPRLLDLAIAVVAGAAGAYVLVRREAIGALPGVAIAVALVPPLATVGMMLELGEGAMAGDALLLYLTNLAGIVLAGSIVMLLLGVRPEPDARGHYRRRAAVGLLGALLATVAVMVPLGIHTALQVVDEAEEAEANERAEEWIEGTELDLVRVAVDGDLVRVYVAGPDPPPDADPLAARLADYFEEEVTVRVSWTEQRVVEASGEPGA